MLNYLIKRNLTVGSIVEINNCNDSTPTKISWTPLLQSTIGQQGVIICIDSEDNTVQVVLSPSLILWYPYFKLNIGNPKKAMSQWVEKHNIKKGDKVKVVYKNFNPSYNYWNDQMDKTINQIGTVESNLEELIHVSFPNSRNWNYTPFNLKIISQKEKEKEKGIIEYLNKYNLRIGDKIKVLRLPKEDTTAYRRTWCTIMDKYIGRKGTIMKICEDDDTVLLSFPYDAYKDKVLWFHLDSLKKDKITFREYLKENDIKVDSLVEVIPQNEATKYIPITTKQNHEVDKYIGQKGTVIRIDPDETIQVQFSLSRNDTLRFPYFRLKKVEAQKEHPIFHTEQEVLVKDELRDKWTYTLFIQMNNIEHPKYPYNTMRGTYRHCIPYKGNESLTGTTQEK